MGRKIVKGQKPSVEVGQVYVTNCGLSCEVIDYNGCEDVSVRFEDGFVTSTYSQSLREGTVRNPFHKSVYGIGYLGQGKYTASIKGKDTLEYKFWKGVLYRCYSEGIKVFAPSYDNCTATDEWHNFQNFAGWASVQVGFKTKGWQLDKDLLVKGNELYSPDTCVFVPPRINGLLIKPKTAERELPTGVVFRDNLYVAQINNGKKVIKLGYYKTAEQAFLEYKKAKEAIYKSVALEWKDLIDEKAFYALYNRTVEITD